MREELISEAGISMVVRSINGLEVNVTFLTIPFFILEFKCLVFLSGSGLSFFVSEINLCHCISEAGSYKKISFEIQLLLMFQVSW